MPATTRSTSTTNHRARLQAEFTRYRPRHSNDNGLAESTNVAFVRKQCGHAQSRSASPRSSTRSARTHKRYPPALVQRPCEKLISIDSYRNFLDEGITPESQQWRAREHTDNDADERLNQARRQFLQSIHRSSAT